MFGFKVEYKFMCEGEPCPLRVECWVSRATEKTIFLWFMFIVGESENHLTFTLFNWNICKIYNNIIIGCVSAALGLAEFWSLGFQRFKVAWGCSRKTKVMKQHRRKPSLGQLEHSKFNINYQLNINIIY